jgi:hypothetical protein
VTISDDFIYLRKEFDRILPNLCRKKITGALDRIEAAYGRHQDAVIDFGTATRLTRDDDKELEARRKDRGEPDEKPLKQKHRDVNIMKQIDRGSRLPGPEEKA